MRAPGPITASGDTRAVGATMAEGSIPGTLGHAAVAVLHAIVLVESGDGAERFVVQALFAERFLEVLFEIVQGLQVVRSGRAPEAAGRAEDLLVPQVHQDADLAAVQDAGALLDMHQAVPVANVNRAIAAADANAAALRGDGEAGDLYGVEAFLKRGHLRGLSAKEHD